MSRLEVTPEMLAAGVAAYRNRDSRVMRERDIVLEIFEAMISTRPSLPIPPEEIK